MENLVNQKYKIKAEILTPLSIGAGSESDWIRGVDFVVEGKKLYHLDMRRLQQAGFDMNRLAALFAVKDEVKVKTLIKGKLNQVSDFVMDMPSSTDNDVKSFVRSQLHNVPIIPGSSLKGAIRSVLFKEFRDNEENDTQVFGNMSDGSDFMRFIRVSDFDFQKTALVNTKIFNLHGSGDEWQGGWKHQLQDGTNCRFNPVGFNTIYECLMPHEIGEGSIMISDMQFQKFGKKQPKWDKKNSMMSFEDGYEPIDNLFDAINSHTAKYLVKEWRFFKKYDQAEKSDLIRSSLVGLKKQVDDLGPGECILKMSVGAGFHSITGDWQYDDYINTGIWEKGRNLGKKKYKSRKVAIHNGQFSLMGFVKLSIVE